MWQYKVEDIASSSEDRLEEYLNSIGESNWELIFVQTNSSGGLRLIFKKKKS